jgi:hypothetical protein
MTDNNAHTKTSIARPENQDMQHAQKKKTIHAHTKMQGAWTFRGPYRTLLRVGVGQWSHAEDSLLKQNGLMMQTSKQDTCR